ncbi:RtcB family protein, partial [Planctomycetota bacterium]
MSEKNYNVIETAGAVPIKAWTKGVLIEEKAQAQLQNMARMPFIHKWVAVMPDVHWGLGATIGSVIPSSAAIIPAAVGVDIGCGMMAVKTSLHAKDLPKDLKMLRTAIENAIPHGRTNNGGRGDRGAWHNIPQAQRDAWSEMEAELNDIAAKHKKIKSRRVNTVNHLGTLGTGNHFIEVCLDTDNKVWFMLHSGSRGIGNRIGSYFIDLAKKEAGKGHIDLPDRNLAYFPEGTPYFNDYMQAVTWAQNFARVNRNLMMRAMIKAVKKMKNIPKFETGEVEVNCHHNYVARENHYGKNVLVTRKGAIRARKDDMGIIPGSMGATSYIVRGLGNDESFHSCSHGAGRVMSRTEARKR